jgi:Protein of unknown function (DUF4232)
MLTSARPHIPSLRLFCARSSLVLAAALAIGTIALPAEPGGALAASTPKCTTSGLVVWLNQEGGGGTLGSIYYKLELTNLSGHPCALYGYPGVAAVSLAGHQLGVAALREPTPSKHVVTLASGSSTLNNDSTATALVRIIDVGVLPGCRPVAAAGLRVYPPGQTRAKVIPFPFEACSRAGRSNLAIRAVTPSE